MARRRRQREVAETPPPVRMRVIEMVRVPASRLRPHPDNWKAHPDGQRLALRAMLRELGFADVLLGRHMTDGGIEIVDGHLRREEMGEQEVPVVILDLNDDETRKLLITLDPLAAMSEADPGDLRALLDQVQTTDQEVAELLTKIAEQFEVLPQLEPVKPPPKQRGSKEIVCPYCHSSFPPP
jgi:ParB-like chromosome segregation protein Spo0J